MKVHQIRGAGLPAAAAALGGSTASFRDSRRGHDPRSSMTATRAAPSGRRRRRLVDETSRRSSGHPVGNGGCRIVPAAAGVYWFIVSASLQVL